MQQKRYGIVIVAAGRGERAGSPENGPKQYRKIGGQSVIRYSVDLFASWTRTSKIVVVIHPDDDELLRRALEGLDVAYQISVVHGGAIRSNAKRLMALSLRRFPVPDFSVHRRRNVSNIS